MSTHVKVPGYFVAGSALGIHFDNSATDWVNGITPSANTGTFDATNVKFGSHSIAYNATNSTEYSAASLGSILALGASDFFFDFWVRFAQSNVYYYFLGQNDNPMTASTSSFYLYKRNDGYVVLSLSTGTGWNNAYSKDSNRIYDTNWHHIRCGRAGSNIYVAVDGIVGSPSGFSYTVPSSSFPLVIGKAGGYGNYFLSGNIDEFTFTKGKAMDTISFVPPAGPHTSGLFREVLRPSVKVGGTWRTVREHFVKVAGVWRNVWRNPGTWTQVASRVTRRVTGPQAFGVFSSSVFYGGGYSIESAGDYTTSMEAFNGSSWSTLSASQQGVYVSAVGSAQTDGRTMGGKVGSTYTTNTRNYNRSFNGTAWTDNAVLPGNRSWGGTAGSTSACLYIGGQWGSGVDEDETFSWNGSSWTTLTNAPVVSYRFTATGTTTAMLLTNDGNISYTFNGSAYTTVANHMYRHNNGNRLTGTMTEATATEGWPAYETTKSYAEGFNGTTWTSYTALPLPHTYLGCHNSGVASGSLLCLDAYGYSTASAPAGCLYTYYFSR